MIDQETKVLITKPVVTGAVAIAADRILMGTTSFPRNLAFATSVAGGVFVSDMIAKHTVGNSVGRSIEARALEIGMTTTAAIATDAYIFRNAVEYNLPSRIITIAASEIIGEYISTCFMMFG